MDFTAKGGTPQIAKKKKMAKKCLTITEVSQIGEGSVQNIKLCTYGELDTYGCARASGYDDASYPDDRVVVAGGAVKREYVTGLKVYHHDYSETTNAFDHYEEITKFDHSNEFYSDPDSYMDEFVVEAVLSTGSHVNVSHSVTVDRISGSTAGITLSTLADGTESVIMGTSKSVANGFKYRFMYRGATKVIDGWIRNPSVEQRLEIGNGIYDESTNSYNIVPVIPPNSNSVYIRLLMKIADNQDNHGYGNSYAVFRCYGTYVIDGRYLNAGRDAEFGFGSVNTPLSIDLENLAATNKIFSLDESSFTDYNGNIGTDKLKSSAIKVSIASGTIASCDEENPTTLTRTLYELRSPSS